MPKNSIFRMKYGIISDIHDDARVIIPAVAMLKSLGADKLVLNGDIGEFEDNLETTQSRLAFILDNVGKSGIEAYVQPGSHELIPGFAPVLKHFAEKYDNIFVIANISQIENPDHHAVFIPGSDVINGEYKLGDEIPTGEYVKLQQGLMPLEIAKERLSKGVEIFGFLSYQNLADLRNVVTDGPKTIVFCHSPSRFKNLENAVDLAEFGTVTEDFTTDIIYYADGEVQIGSLFLPKKVDRHVRCKKFKNGHVIVRAIAEKFVRVGLPVEMVKANVGSKELASIYSELGITKAVSCHIHESAHNATDSEGNPVEEGKFVSELFWNASHADSSKFGILSVENGTVCYKNVTL